MDDFDNPARRYKWFRPRQAMRGSGFQSSTNFAAVSLFNNSTGAHWLVVRAVRMQSDSANYELLDFTTQGGFGTIAQAPQPVVTSQAPAPGLIYNNDAAAIPPDNGYAFNGLQNSDAWWEHDFPIAVIGPGFTYGIIQQTKAVDLTVAFLWEAIEADQLDYLY